MTTFFNTIKKLVSQFQPNAGTSEALGLEISHSEEFNTSGYSLHKLSVGECSHYIHVMETKAGPEWLRIIEDCPDHVTHIFDKDGDGVLETGDELVFNPYTDRAVSYPLDKAALIYQSMTQRLTEKIEALTHVGELVPKETLAGKAGFLAIHQNHIDLYLTASKEFGSEEAYLYAKDALEKTKAILMKLSPNLRGNQSMTLGVWGGNDLRFDGSENVPTIFLPLKPEQGPTILIGFILTLLNIPKEEFDADGQRAIEMFTAFVELKKGVFENFLDYLLTQKIYPAHFYPILEQKVLEMASIPYQAALEHWQDGEAETTLRYLAQAQAILAHRPPPSASELSLALDEKARVIEGLTQKSQQLKKGVEEKNVAEVVQLLEADDLIHLQKLSQLAKASGHFRDIKISDVSWNQQGRLLLLVDLDYDCGDHHRLFSDRTETDWYFLYGLRRLEETFADFAAKIKPEKKCIEKGLHLSISGGWKGVEYNQFWSGSQTLLGGPRLELTYYPQPSNWKNKSFVALGLDPWLHQVDLGGGDVWHSQKTRFKSAVKLSYQRESFEDASPVNILKLGWSGEARIYPFYFSPYLDRLAVGLNVDLGAIAGVAFKDGWFNDIRWVPFWGALFGMAGIEF